MTTLFRACIYQPKFKADPLTKAQIEALSGFVSMKPVGGAKRFLAFKFQITDNGDVTDINDALGPYLPVYCFSETCPRLPGDFQCPAVR